MLLAYNKSSIDFLSIDTLRKDLSIQTVLNTDKNLQQTSPIQYPQSQESTNSWTLMNAYPARPQKTLKTNVFSGLIGWLSPKHTLRWQQWLGLFTYVYYLVTR